VSALAGVRVLDLTRFLAGPFCTAILADHGAEVVKVETPRLGDEGRAGYSAPKGVPIAFLALNRNKKGITLDVRTEEGRALFRRLLPHFDVLVENFAGGTLADWGLAPEALVREHPRLIVVSLSGFGQTGPWARRPSYDIVAQASGGLMALTGFPDAPPTRGGGSLGDYIAGLTGAIGVLTALAARARTGRGQCVDVSSQDAIFALADHWPTVHAATGELPARVGNRHLATAPYDCHRALDGWVVVAIANNKLYRRLMEAIGRPELGTDPRFRGGAGRRERSVEINGIVGAWVAEHTVTEVLDALSPERANVPCAPVYGIDELLAHPQLLAREMIVRLPHDTVGEVTVTGVPVKLSGTPGAVRHLGPTIGQHNDEVFGGLLGLSTEEMDRLRAADVI
jgi:crotonobetainyl-CoA:carnitine CoA-transferase CaiB-like acyl-CoA transferase